MGNAAIAYLNLADSGSVTASSQASAMPASYLQDPHVSMRWRSRTNDDFFVVDLLSSQSIDTVLVRGMTVSASSTVRIRISTADSSGADGDASDSGSLISGSTYFDADYGAIVFTTATPVTGRYVRIDISDPDGSYVDAGRVFVGLRTQFSYNFNWGWGIGYTDRSTKIKSRGGQTLVLTDNSFRTINVDLAWVSSSQRYGIIETIDRVNGTHLDVLLITDTDSTNLARDTIFGLISNQSPVTNPALADIFGKQYQIEERL